MILEAKLVKTSISLERLLMRLMSAGLVLVFITGCVHSGKPATAVSDNWIFTNCSPKSSLSGNSCSEYSNCEALTSSRIGACRCEYPDGSVYQGVISKGQPWCGIRQDGSDTLIVRNGSTTAEKIGIDWATTALWVAFVGVAVDMLDHEPERAFIHDE